MFRSLLAATILSLPMHAFAQMTVEFDLGTLAPGPQQLVWTTLGQPSEVCRYRNSGLGYGGFREFGGEIVYQFRVALPSTLSLTNNEGFFVGTDQDHYLLEGNSTTPNVDINGDGSEFCTVGENLIGFVDEQGNFGAMLEPGTDYFLAVDTYIEFGNTDGPFDITLSFASDVLLADLNCDGAVDANDIAPFCLAVNDPAGYAAAYPNCGSFAADLNLDGRVDRFDEPLFCDALIGSSGSPAGCTGCIAPACPGDANGDNVVNFTDLNFVLGNFQQTGAPGIPGDLNGDGVVNITDLNQVLGNFSQLCI